MDYCWIWNCTIEESIELKGRPTYMRKWIKSVGRHSGGVSGRYLSQLERRANLGPLIGETDTKGYVPANSESRR